MKRYARIMLSSGPLLLAGSLALVLVSREEPRDAGPTRAEGREAPGEPAPDLFFQTLDGSTASLPDYAGRVVVLNLWGTWCAPCRYEIPELAELHSAYRERGAVVIGLAIDSGDAARIRAFAEQYGVNYPIWTSTGAIAVSEFGAVGYPLTLLVDRGGLIRKKLLGPQSFSTLAAEVDALLEDGGRSAGTS